MKYLVILSFFVFICSCERQEKDVEKTSASWNSKKQLKPSKESIQAPEIESLIVRCDTLNLLNTSKLQEIRKFDKQGRLRSSLKKNFYESNTERFRTEYNVFDTLGRVIFQSESIGMTTSAYKFEYNRKDGMVSKTGYGFGEDEVKLVVIYDNSRLLK